MKTFERPAFKEQALFKMVLSKNVVIPACPGIVSGDCFYCTDAEAKNLLAMRIAKLAPGERLPEWIDEFQAR